MHTLPRQLLIGIVVSLCVVGALGASWWVTMGGRPADDLAARLPATSVLAYAILPLPAAFSPEVVPSLPAIPDLEASTEALALVRTADGTQGWITLVRAQNGTAQIHGSNSALEPLLQQTDTPLARDRTFRSLRWNDSGWAYLAFPHLPSEGSAFSQLLALESPLAVRSSGSGITLRLALSPTPRIGATFADRPLITLASDAQTVHLPSWRAMTQLAPLLSRNAQLIAETIGKSFLATIAQGVSLPYDASLLLDEPSLLRLLPNASGGTIFALEGHGRSGDDVDHVLQALHEQFASTRGSAHIKTVSAEGFTMQTVTQEEEAATTTKHDGPWTILETTIDGTTLISAQNGPRFALTNAPEALLHRSDSPDTASGSMAHTRIHWTQDIANGLRPVWPGLQPAERILDSQFTEGPGFLEWSLGPLKSL